MMNKICIVGIGNTLRSDDGIGAYIARAIETMDVPNVDCLTVHQLQTELVEELIHYDTIILTDAAEQDLEIDFKPLGDMKNAISSSHHINAEMLYSVADKMFDKKLNIFLCAVKGENFEIGEKISSIAKERAKQAIELIVDFIRK